jgi:hypothetical protein
MGALALLIALGLIVLALVPRAALDLMPRGLALALVAAALNIAFAGLITWYVFRTQVGLHNESAWNNRLDAGEHRLYVVVMGVVALSVAVLVLLALRRTNTSLVRGAILASGVVNLVLGWMVLIAFEVD